MKILIICNYSSGLYKFRGMLIQQLVKQGHTVRAIVPKLDDKTEIKEENNLKRLHCHHHGMRASSYIHVYTYTPIHVYMYSRPHEYILKAEDQDIIKRLEGREMKGDAVSQCPSRRMDMQ